MPQYVMTYHGGNQLSTPAEDQRHFACYLDWLDSLGDSAVSPANPFANTHRVSPDGAVSTGATTAMSGFTIIAAASMDAALAVAKSWPVS
jgi:hypothetical protein